MYVTLNFANLRGALIANVKLHFHTFPQVTFSVMSNWAILMSYLMGTHLLVGH